MANSFRDDPVFWHGFRQLYAPAALLLNRQVGKGLAAERWALQQC
jgi:hypothetical protein